MGALVRGIGKLLKNPHNAFAGGFVLSDFFNINIEPENKENENENPFQNMPSWVMYGGVLLLVLMVVKK